MQNVKPGLKEFCVSTVPYRTFEMYRLTRNIEKITTKWTVLFVSGLQWIVGGSSFSMAAYAEDMQSVFDMTQAECETFSLFIWPSSHYVTFVEN